MNHINDGSGQADRPGLRGQLVKAMDQAWDRMQEAITDHVMATVELEKFDAEEFGLEMHRAAVAEAGPNIDLSEVEIEDELVADFCAGSRICHWHRVEVGSGFETGERLFMQKHRADVLEKAAVSFLQFVTGDTSSTWPWMFETEVVSLPGGTI